MGIFHLFFSLFHLFAPIITKMMVYAQKKTASQKAVFLMFLKDNAAIYRKQIAALFVAEGVGFEPTSPCGLPDFESGPL